METVTQAVIDRQLEHGAAAAPTRDTADTPWRRSLLWLLFLGPFFFVSYGFANGLAAQRGVSDSIVFGWERHIPFLPWTIVPYWSIDLLYGLSFLACRTRAEVDRHALRLLSVQIVSVLCFVLFPLRFGFERPPVQGAFGWMFDALASFDQPYNQAPSLHIGLLVVLWVRCLPRTPSLGRALVHAWFALIGVSVLTTWQHHFIDVPTGVLVGLLGLWLWPDHGPSPLAAWRLTASAVRRRLAALYLLAAGALALVAAATGGAALWLLWGSVALALVGLCHAGAGAAGFQKHEGRHAVAVALLCAPYVLGAWLNSRAWTRRHPGPDAVADGVWLGRMPSSNDMRRGGFAGLLDLSAELPAPHGPWAYENLPWLDLVAPEPDQLREAARRIEALRTRGPLLVCCALGCSRSACAVAAWLLHTGRAGTVRDAVEQVQAHRPCIVLGAQHHAALAASLEHGVEAAGHG